MTILVLNSACAIGVQSQEFVKQKTKTEETVVKGDGVKASDYAEKTDYLVAYVSGGVGEELSTETYAKLLRNLFVHPDHTNGKSAKIMVFYGQNPYKPQATTVRFYTKREIYDQNGGEYNHEDVLMRPIDVLKNKMAPDIIHWHEVELKKWKEKYNQKNKID